MMEYKGNLGEAEFDESVGVLHGRVVNVRPILTFESDRASDVRSAFEDTVDDYLAWYAEDGREPEQPFSGTLLMGGTPELHRAVALAAARQNKSMNAWTTEVLAKAAGIGGL